MVGAFIVFLGSAALMFGASSDQAPSPNSNAIVAEVDGVGLTYGQLENKRSEVLFHARNTFFESEKKALTDYIDDYLLERQAQKENTTVAKLLEQHVNGAIEKDPDDAALRVYYEGLDTKEPFEAVRGKILDHIRDIRITKAKIAYMDSLRNQAKITIELQAPRMAISLKDQPVRGPAGAPIQIVEYADYECPYCQQAQPAIDRLEADFKGKISFAFKDFPLPMHTHAEKAAEAAQCAALQGKYWEYHDILFKEKNLDLPQLKVYGSKLGLDTASFDKCLDSGDRANVVKVSQEEAQKLRLQGTPSFFINGRFFNGIMSYEQLRQAIEEELHHSSAQARTE
jgi:protein-disulfide isomerase